MPRLEHPDALRIDGAATQRVRRVRGDEAEAWYPPAARQQRLEGHVIVYLLINAEGFVVEAGVLAEEPAGHGFGLAALDVAKTYEFDNGLRRLVLMETGISFLP